MVKKIKQKDSKESFYLQLKLISFIMTLVIFMVYLDYSATTPVNDEVLDTFIKVNKNYLGNPNSLHKLGVESKKLMDEATNQIADLFEVSKEEIIYTSGGSEANNLAIKGVAFKYIYRHKHIITTKMEHSSILETVKHMESQGFKVSYINILENGLIDLDHLETLLKDSPMLVSISFVNSEVGIKQDIEKIGKLIKEISKTTLFHVDGTGAVGKIKINLNDIDLFSCSAHKFYGLKGLGLLIKKQNISLEPLIHGGKSTTIYRAGTPALGLIVAMSKALRLALLKLNDKYEYVTSLNKYLIKELTKITALTINSNKHCIPHIINISVPLIKSETIIHALEQRDIFISTKTACSKEDISLSLEAMHKSQSIAKTSLRISLSYLTTKEELEIFIKNFKEVIDTLILKKGE